MYKKITFRLSFVVLFSSSLALAEYVDIQKSTIKSCWAYNRIKHRVSETKHTTNSNRMRLRRGHKYRIIETRDDIGELRIEVDYIAQGSVRHRWVDRSCFYKK